jgi:ApaG protein
LASALTTNQITVQVCSVFLDDYSNADEDNFLFCYKITITNEGSEIVQLLRRHWVIIDSNSTRSVVEGEGVIGEQPVLKPGEDYSYFSFCTFNTNFGTMEGHYIMISDEHEEFKVEVPRFFLSTNLNEFPKNVYKRGQIVVHNKEDYTGLVVDFDMYFLANKPLNTEKYPASWRLKPWYYVLIHDTDMMLYVPEAHLSKSSQIFMDINHPLVNTFFERKDERYIRKKEDAS